MRVLQQSRAYSLQPDGDRARILRKRGRSHAYFGQTASMYSAVDRALLGTARRSGGNSKIFHTLFIQKANSPHANICESARLHRQGSSIAHILILCAHATGMFGRPAITPYRPEMKEPHLT